ncbi:MAG: ABC transporter ATP-binding protein [Thermomicrobiales bacterium]|nr:ABC transporter ATP-binding protein [Thermomicrobiales bacterium]
MATETAGQTPAATERHHDRTGATVRIDHLDKRFDSVAAVQDVSFDIEAGEFITMLGPSGSGKTTTLMMIAGFEIPTSGEIYIDSSPVATIPPFRRNIGMVFQNYALFPHMTVAENIAFPLKMRKVDKATIERRVGEVLEAVRLPDYGRRYPRQLSGGQQQRIALARAIVFNPRVLLMDEPLGALDKKLREEMQLEIRRLHQELGITFIYVTHDQEEALVMSDRIVVMNNGRVVQIGDPRDLYDRPCNRFVASFIGESNFLEGAIVSGADGTHTVQIGDTTLKAVGVEGLPSGDPAVVAIRPEKLSFMDNGFVPDAAQNVFDATVVEAAFVGDTRRYVMQTDTGSQIVLRQQQRFGVPSYGPGERVRIVCHVEDTRIVAAE